MCEGLFEVPYTIRILQVGPDYWQLVQLLQQPGGLEKSSDDRRKKSSFDNHEDNYEDNATVNGGNPTSLRSGKALQFPSSIRHGNNESFVARISDTAILP